MNRFEFLPLKSPIHELHPLLKLLCCFIFLITATIIYDPIPNMVFFVYTVIIAVLVARIPARAFARTILPFSFIAVGAFMSQVIFRGGSGTTILLVGPINVTQEATHFGLALAFRMLTIISISLVFAMTTNPKDFALSLVQQLKVNYRIAYALFYALRMVPQSENELSIIRSAQRIRGVGVKSGFFGVLQEYLRFTLPLLISLIRKTDRAAVAMESKAFGAYPQRTYLDQISVRSKDVVIVVIVVVILFLTVVYLREVGLLERIIFTSQTIPE